MTIDKIRKAKLEEALRELEERYNPGQGDNWKFKGNRIEFYTWEFVKNNKHKIEQWLDLHKVTYTSRFGAFNSAEYGTIYLAKHLPDNLKTLFSLTFPQ